MPVPTVTGLMLDVALEILAEAGIGYDIVESSPPGRPRPGGVLRVIRQRTGAGGRVSLVVAPALPEKAQ
jgi:hypothetical protein